MLAITGRMERHRLEQREAEALLERREQHDGRVLVAPAQRAVVGAAEPDRDARGFELARAARSSPRCAGPGGRAPRAGSPGASRDDVGQMSSSIRTFLRGARSPTTRANGVPAELRRPAPGSVSSRLRLRPFGATTVFGSQAGSRSRRRSRVASLAATRPVASSSDVRYWRGRKQPLRERRLVRPGDRHHVVDGEDRRERGPGDEVLRPVDDLRAGLREARPARVALPERDRRAGRGRARRACASRWPAASRRTRSAADAGAATTRRRRRGGPAPRELAGVAADPARAVERVGEDADAKRRGVGCARFLHVRQYPKALRCAS